MINKKFCTISFIAMPSRALHQLLIGMVFAFSLCAASAPATSAESTVEEVTEEFDHLATGFPLLGRHQLISCESCHQDGVFKGIPKQCSSCHDGKFARGMHINHIPTNEQCSVCHNPRGFSLSVIMDHSTTSAPCAFCHNGVMATGKDADHIPTGNNCASCHITVAWSIVSAFDHSEISSEIPCETCHNGKNATGKNASHVQSTNDCAACHIVAPQFRPVARVDHSQTQASCGNAGCHQKSGNHPATSNKCLDCHISPFWTPTQFDNPTKRATAHLAATPGRCVDCHALGASASPSGSSIVAPPASPAHIPTTASCDVCHIVTAWTPTKGPVHSLLVITDNCVQCHVNGINATAKSAAHPTTTSLCAACHVPGRALGDWRLLLKTPVDHTQTTDRCGRCHDGVIATGKDKKADHVITSLDCGSCHKTSTWLGAAVDHTNINTGCVTCHNGNPVSGKSGRHTQGGLVTTDECQACHKKFPDSWKAVLPFDHSQSPVTTCQTCHTGTGAPAKIGKSSTHPTTSELCSSCHVFAQWKPVTKIDHALATGPCVQCHNGSIANAAGKPQTHPTTNDVCVSCHVTTAWKPITKLDHAAATGPCEQCHNGTVTNARAKPPTHPTTSNVCVLCHVSSGWKPVTKVDHAAATGPCVQCHVAGITATPKPTTLHPTTTNVCEGCHVPPSVWKPVTKVDHAQATGLCGQCHDGVIATGKNKKANHVVTTADCGACHKLPAWLPAGVDHVPITNNCNRCHGVTAPGKNVGHFNTTDVCEACHSKAPDKWSVILRVDHNQTLGACVSCHIGPPLATGKGGRHTIQGLPTNDNCTACHNTAPLKFSPIKTFSHIDAPANACVSCHNGSLAIGKDPLTHPSTTPNCVACHNQASWAVAPSQVNHTEVLGSCAAVGCHNNTILTQKPDHIPILAPYQCEACHFSAPQTWAQIRTVDHTQVTGTCFSCHGGIAGISAMSGDHLLGMQTSNNCNACHGTPPSATWPAPISFQHSETTAPCGSCHIGPPLATGKGPNHLTTTNNCAGCHPVLVGGSAASWAVATTNHSEVLGTCESCHNGTTKGQAKPAGHCAYDLGTDCNVCHLPLPSSWANTIAGCPAVVTVPTPGAPTPTPVPAAPPPMGGMGMGGMGGM